MRPVTSSDDDSADEVDRTLDHIFNSIASGTGKHFPCQSLVPSTLYPIP